MFKIDRVVIRGEKSKSCNECPYSIYDAESDGYICYAMVVGEQDNLITDTHTRPDWCPLEKYCEICDGVGFVLHATQGTMPCPECNQESEE